MRFFISVVLMLLLSLEEIMNKRRPTIMSDNELAINIFKAATLANLWLDLKQKSTAISDCSKNNLKRFVSKLKNVHHSAPFISVWIPNIEVMVKFANSTFYQIQVFFLFTDRFSLSGRGTSTVNVVCWCAIPEKELRLKAGRAVSLAAKPCPLTIPLILLSYAELTSRLQVEWTLKHTDKHKHCVAGWCDFLSISCVFLWTGLTLLLFPFSAYRVSVYRGYRRLSS